MRDHPEDPEKIQIRTGASRARGIKPLSLPRSLFAPYFVQKPEDKVRKRGVPLLYGDRVFDSMKEASKALGISYNFIVRNSVARQGAPGRELVEKPPQHQGRPPIRAVYDGVVYESRTRLRESLGWSRRRLYKEIKVGTVTIPRDTEQEDR